MTGLYENKTRVIRYQEGDTSLERIYPFFPPGKNRAIHVIRDGDDLLSIAYQYYRDEKLWYIIATDNGIINPFELTVGSILYIPYDNG